MSVIVFDRKIALVVKSFAVRSAHGSLGLARVAFPIPARTPRVNG